jgi:hypothetical protein
MTLKMPEPRQETLDQRAMIIEALRPRSARDDR